MSRVPRLVLLLAGALAAALALPASARSPSEREVATRIRAILAQPEFATTRPGYEYHYVPDAPDKNGNREPSNTAPSGFLSFLASAATFIARFFEALVWALLVAGLVLLVVYRRQWLRLLPARAPPTAVRPRSTPIFGEDPRHEALPGDVVAAALARWRAGDPRGCLSLLYRGALAAFASRLELDLGSAETEGECVRRIRARAAADPGEYFSELTRAWQRVAYGRGDLDEARLESLCAGWRAHLGAGE